MRLLIPSASSKTGYGIASLAHSRGGIEVVGITGQRNAAFARQLGCYDAVITYGDVESLPKVPTLYADVAGDTELRHRLHRHLAGDLTHDAVLGISHISSPTSLDTGPKALQDHWNRLQAGDVNPRQGVVVTFSAVGDV